MILARALGSALEELLDTDPRVVVLGEDIADPYGGAFKVTRGLSTAFPDRVRTTPISEAAIAGIAGGLALEGFRPIVEVMFGDFLTLSFDQVVNHIVKYGSMYNGQVRCPVIIRTPSGGGRGYGPTHSQSLEKHFFGVPDLLVVAASLYHDPREIFACLLAKEQPVLYLEHKLLYPEHLRLPEAGRVGDHLAHVEQGDTDLPTVCIAPVPREDCVLTVLAYGYQAVLVEQVIERLAIEEELFVELVVPAQIAPLDWAPIQRCLEATGALLCVEEGTAAWSWGSEVAAVLGLRLFGRLRKPIRLVTSKPSVIPSAKHLENEVIVGADQIEAAIREAAG